METKWIDLMLVFRELNSIYLLEGCSQSEFQILLTIDDCSKQTSNDRINVNKIAEVLKISVPAVSKSLKNLETKKMIKRKIDVFCRRNTYVELTNLGKSVLDKNLDVIKKSLEDALGEEVDEKLATMVGVATQIKNALCKGGEDHAIIK